MAKKKAAVPKPHPTPKAWFEVTLRLEFPAGMDEDEVEEDVMEALDAIEAPPWFDSTCSSVQKDGH